LQLKRVAATGIHARDSNRRNFLYLFDKNSLMPLIKKPVDGDFRVQSYLEESTLWFNQLQHLLKKSTKIVNTFPDHLLYARVDGIIINSELHLMEIECIEPDLYFNLR
jgi:hypothetical protein